MGDAIGQMLASATGIALSPLACVAVILLGPTPRGRVNSRVFAAGWALTLAALATAAVFVSLALSRESSRWLKLVAGLLLLYFGLRQWRDRPRVGHVHPPPRWLRAIDRLSPARSAGLAAELLAAAPKNLLLALGAGVSIGSSTASPWSRVLAVVLLVLVGSLCTLLPLGMLLFGGSRATGELGEWRAWLSAHNAPITMAVLLVLGAQYVGAAISWPAA